MAISTTPVHQAVSATTSVTITAAASGNTLIAVISSFRSPAARTVSSIAATNTTGWVKIGGATNGAGTLDVEVWAGNCTGISGTTVTITMSGTSSILAVNVSEWSGVVTPTAADGTAGTNTNTGTAASTGAYSATGNDIVIACVGYLSGTAVTTQPGGTWGNLTGEPDSTSVYIQGNYIVPAVVGAQSATWTIPNVSWVSVLVGLKVSPKISTLTAATVAMGASLRRGRILTAVTVAMSVAFVKRISRDLGTGTTVAMSAYLMVPVTNVLMRGRLITSSTVASSASLIRGKLLTAATVALSVVFNAAKVGPQQFNQAFTAATTALSASLARLTKKFFSGS